MKLHDLSESTTSELGWQGARKRLPVAGLQLYMYCHMIDMGKINSPTRPKEEEEGKEERERAHPRPNMTAPARPERKKRKGKERPNLTTCWATWPRLRQRFERTKTKHFSLEQADIFGAVQSRKANWPLKKRVR